MATLRSTESGLWLIVFLFFEHLRMKQSAGLIPYRFKKKTPEYFLVHPGGPFWKNKDAHAWSISKGEFVEEEALTAAFREFEEETGMRADGKLIQLNPVKQSSGKLIHAWGIAFDFDHEKIRSNVFEMEWPPKSGKKASFPEVDKGAWFSLKDAEEKIIKAQFAMLVELERKLLDNVMI